jgi:precorrin-8X/cobalt-precorrin-8 methylmutase
MEHGTLMPLKDYLRRNDMEHLIIIGHGSPLKEANNLEAVGRLLHSALHDGCKKDCVSVAYLQFGNPDLMECIRTAVDGGAKKVIIHPYFLTSGMHVTKDIPMIIEEAKGLYPHVEFLYTEPLGFHESLVEIIKDRIKGHLRPHEIEERSFEIIEEETEMRNIPFEEKEVIKRVVHATADPEFINNMVISSDAIKTGIEAIRAGRDILVDVEMVRAGISKRLLREFGIKVHCYIDDEDFIRISEATGRTRAEIAMEKALNENNNIGIIAIGNAPTALLKVIEILNNSPFSATVRQCGGATERGGRGELPLVIGVPVGFVKALESKVLLSAQRFPFITNLSRKGGSAVAVAAVNALLKMALRKEEA